MHNHIKKSIENGEIQQAREEKKIDTTKITIIDYDEHQCREKEALSVEECRPFKDAPTVTWINIDGLHQRELIEKVGEVFNLHHLTVDDIINTRQRPKIEDFGDYILTTLKMLFYNEEKETVDTEQVSLILGSNFVISFQEDKEGDVFDSVRERIRSGTSRVRQRGSDYLVYCLMNAIVSSYFQVVEKLGEKIEVLEEEVVFKPKPETLQSIHSLKKVMIFLRRSVWPLREIITCLERGESKFIKQTTSNYLRDLYELSIQVIDSLEAYREILLGMLEAYLSSVSNRMNEVMKVLTIIATIFIPLTFIAGIYGMNFKFMPELGFKGAYFVVLGIMILIGVTMVILFRKKRWL